MFFNAFIAFAAIAAANVQAALYTEDKTVLKTMWTDFKQKFAKKYATAEEEELRFNIFVDKIQVIDERNARELQAGGNAVHGVTRFSDLTSHEFRTTYLTTIRKDESSEAATVEITRPVDMVAGFIDWTDIYTT